MFRQHIEELAVRIRKWKLRLGTVGKRTERCRMNHDTHLLPFLRPLSSVTETSHQGRGHGSSLRMKCPSTNAEKKRLIRA